MNRFWDPKDKYKGAVLKEFVHWMLEVSFLQHTFGNYIVFCKRECVQKISELKDEELLELKQVFKEIETALLENPTFKPIRFNYWQMGNKLKHLHFHGIPRYESPREFLGRTWKDPDSNTVPIWTTEEESQETVETLREEMGKCFKN